ncbi:hypothetical protein DYB32_002311 [Aphanomyces invadans]|uniref:CRC domain-containing protein n=1 Tax=Aphanomyces invadans TaxID=157072 RepID=A0A3R6YD73_9STRA|nr:hypothetical protein DYB32_002311 [Aphanomyces invadans]
MGKDSVSSYALTTPVMLKKKRPKKQEGGTNTNLPPSAEKAGPLASPFSGWKVEQGEKYRFILSPLPSVVATPITTNDDDNRSFLTFAQSASSVISSTPLVASNGSGGLHGPTTNTPKKRNPCNCKKSQCLKLYCECFASGGYCDENCKCVGCHNIPKFEAQRKDAIAVTLERNPNAFKPKINHALSDDLKHNSCHYHPNSTGGSAKALVKTHHHGCHCKKSFCQKKYCECFQAGVPCGENCKCIQDKSKITESTAKRKLIVYPLFGASQPPLQKDIAVHILQHLDGPDIYNASIVNRLWNGMTMSEDIWDYSQLDKVP